MEKNVVSCFVRKADFVLSQRSFGLIAFSTFNQKAFFNLCGRLLGNDFQALKK